MEYVPIVQRVVRFLEPSKEAVIDHVKSYQTKRLMSADIPDKSRPDDR